LKARLKKVSIVLSVALILILIGIFLVTHANWFFLGAIAGGTLLNFDDGFSRGICLGLFIAFLFFLLGLKIHFSN